MYIKKKRRIVDMCANNMISSTITADPGLGSVSDGRCHTRSNALLSVFGNGIFSCSVHASYFAPLYISSVADSICPLNHSHSASFPFLHLDLYSLSHLISILDTIAAQGEQSKGRGPTPTHQLLTLECDICQN